MNVYDKNGDAQDPMFYSEDAPVNQMPYTQQTIKFFMNMSVVETHLYQHLFLVYDKAPEMPFCNLTAPEGMMNHISPGVCGVNGFIASGSNYGVATHEKDGSSSVFTVTGVLNNAGRNAADYEQMGTITPVGGDSIQSEITSAYYRDSETYSFSNDAKTTISGSGQHYQVQNILRAASSSNPMELKETYNFQLDQTNMQNFVAQLTSAQEAAMVPVAGRVEPISSGDCLPYVIEGCPEESDYVAAEDPSLTSSPYDDDSTMKGGYIAMFVILGVMVLAFVALFAHWRHVNNQKDRYKHQFARRIAQTIEFEGAMKDITPEALTAEFERIDEDKSGSISKPELKAFIGDRMSDSDFEAMFAAIDLDHNGTVDFEEFCAFMTHVGAMPDIKDEKIVDVDEGDGEEHKAHLNPAFDDKVAAAHTKTENQFKILSVVLFLCTLGLLAATITLAVKDDDDNNSSQTSGLVGTESVVYSNVPDNTPFDIETVFEREVVNVCDKKKLEFPNTDCIHGVGPQAGANVTNGYQGDLDMMGVTPQEANYWQVAMCPVNVHWHLGTEHYSVGEYDEFGDGPNGNADPPTRKLQATGEGDFQEFNVRGGFRCHHYNVQDTKFTTEYDWKHCKGMEVGETYEVHWPHSAAGACGTVNQYQTPFYDGVFCGLDLPSFSGLLPQQIASAVGVQGQIFTVVNDESYFYPDLIRGWVVNPEVGMAQDVAKYTGSTTGTSRDNNICSPYSPITWHVDRKCHMISASSFDKLCYDMKQQLDDMTDDLHAHGSRELVNSTWAANNFIHRERRGLRSSHDDHHHHHHSHDGHDDHDHHHHQWF
uniref:EF-hand domain-containing protein n=1 Tax=Entomoneis paludosa TaxID=265537 RepID=A0A6U3DDF4_9STRA